MDENLMTCKEFWLLLFGPDTAQQEVVDEAMRAHARECEPCRKDYIAIEDALDRKDRDTYVRIIVGNPIIKEAADETGLAGRRWVN